jgi:hypothetical protein
MTDKIIEVQDLDCIYLSYDEPQKEEFWHKIKNMVPWARRVDGVKGSDAAHKAAAQESDTERFILIDGDNMPDMSFFDLTFDFTDLEESYTKAQYRWKARNNINGLIYGNGGMSSWTKDYVMNMKTHEASDGNNTTTVDFCLDYNNSLYWSMNDCYSTTYPNQSPFQAWRAGFREGVKMCLVEGITPSITEFKRNIPGRNLDNLTIWHNVGQDVENGMWAIYGARVGTYMTMLQDFNPVQVQWFDNLEKLWQDHKDNDPRISAELFGNSLRDKLDLPINTLDRDQSKFFKRHYNKDRPNVGPLIKEIDVIRKIEGW